MIYHKVKTTIGPDGEEFISKEELDRWPNCKVFGCKNKICTWLSPDKCHPHAMEDAEELVAEEMEAVK